ncbi:hypothetical protein [Bifidobacterium moukalabense]|uniref:hypothetical protein n=1 Tax=Bifidobacterium moukalabense TaxID=1333651 RepID=UPI001FCEB6FB|nr:hypothetical protein [Bifidobacterium moukalabense]
MKETIDNGFIPYFDTNNQIPLEQDSRTESYELSEEDKDLLDEDFVIPVNDLCGSLIGPTDVDYLNAEQCKLMLGWLEQRLKEPVNPRLETIYRKLVEFARKAIKLDTGIVFDL